MDADSCYELGIIGKKHGLDGAVSITLDVTNPSDYRDLESVFVEMGKKLVPFFIQWIRLQGKKAVVKFEDVESIDQASELQACRLFLPIEALPKLQGNKFYYHEVIGYNIVDSVAGLIGPIQEVFSSGPQEVFAVLCQEKEVLIPVGDDIIKEVDRDKKQINVVLPDGLLEIYLEE